MFFLKKYNIILKMYIHLHFTFYSNVSLRFQCVTVFSFKLTFILTISEVSH